MIEKRNFNGVYVLGFNGEVSHREMVEMRNTISELILDGHFNVVVSLEKVGRIDHLGIGILVERLKRLRRCGGDMKITGMSRYMKNFFMETGITDHLDSFESLSEALSSFSSGRCPDKKAV